MSVNPAQSWITPTTSLFGAGGVIETPQTVQFSIAGDVAADTGPPAASLLWYASTGVSAVKALTPAYFAGSGAFGSGLNAENWVLTFQGPNATAGNTNALDNLGARGTVYSIQNGNGAGFGYVGSDNTDDTVLIGGYDAVGNGTYEYWRSQNGTIGISSLTTTIGTNDCLFTALPAGGAVRILPSTNQINVQNLVFVSTISPLGVGGSGIEGTINMTELCSSIKGYGWATVGPAVP